MIATTLCYIKNNKDEYLLLHRVKKVNDINEGKWIGVGGKLEEGETPDQCVRRNRAYSDKLPLPRPCKIYI